MKRIFAALLTGLVLACSQGIKPHGRDAGQGRVAIVDHWVVSSPSEFSDDMKAVTFVVRNTTPKDVEIIIVCRQSDGSMFGESFPGKVASGKDAKLMVRGFLACPTGDCHQSLDCRIESAR
jgi:hypothetical protein